MFTFLQNPWYDYTNWFQKFHRRLCPCCRTTAFLVLPLSVVLLFYWMWWNGSCCNCLLLGNELILILWASTNPLCWPLSIQSRESWMVFASFWDKVGTNLINNILSLIAENIKCSVLWSYCYVTIYLFVMSNYCLLIALCLRKCVIWYRIFPYGNNFLFSLITSVKQEMDVAVH